MAGNTLQKKVQLHSEVIILLTIFFITFIAYLIPALKIVPRDDELDYLMHAENLLRGKITISPQRGYFFSIVLAVPLFIFGNKLIVAQITAVLLGAMVVFPTYLFTRELFRKKTYNKQLGMICAMMTSWMNFKYAVEIRNDTLFIFVFMYACYFGIKGVREPHYLKYAGIFIGLAYFTRDPGILLLPAIIIYFIFNSNSTKKLGVKKRLKLLFNINILTMVVIFLLSTIPKYLLRWYIYGHPLYTQNTYSYFWMDDYYDKYYVYLNTMEASMRTYLSTHTIPQMIDRFLSGAETLIDHLSSGLSWPILGSDIFSVIFSIFSLIGLILLAKREYSMIPLNLGFWFILFAWLFEIRSTTRWIVPMFTLLAIASIFAIIEFTIFLKKLFIQFIKPRLPLVESRFTVKLPPLLLTVYNTTKKRLQDQSLWNKYIPHVIIIVLFASFTTGLAIRSEQGFPSKKADESYYALREMADWITINTPEDAFFMSEQEDIIKYYARREAMFIPPSDLEFILQTIVNQGVDYIVIETSIFKSRSALKPVFEGELLPEGFTLVYKNYVGDLSEATDIEFKIQIYSTTPST